NSNQHGDFDIFIENLSRKVEVLSEIEKAKEDLTWRRTPRKNRAPGTVKTKQLGGRLRGDLVDRFTALSSTLNDGNKTLTLETAIEEFLEKYER
ncbi:MAG: hypothetical protein AAF986_06040, partial [Pseudomonadota bacterium]